MVKPTIKCMPNNGTLKESSEDPLSGRGYGIADLQLRMELTLRLQENMQYEEAEINASQCSVLDAPLPERRIVLLGKTGAGKSATGNTILGEERFLSKFSFVSTTNQSMAQQAVVDGRLVSVIDTPGLFDTRLSQEELAVELGRSIYESAPGPHAFVIVLQLGKYTKQEDQIVKLIRETYGEQALKYTIILFTHGDVLEGSDVGELIEENEALSQLVQQCEQRYHVLNNRDKTNRDQAIQLLRKIDEMMEKNGGEFYTNDMYREAGRLQRERREQTEQQSGGGGDGGVGGIGNGGGDGGGGGFWAFLKRHWKKLLAGAIIGGAIAFAAVGACGPANTLLQTAITVRGAVVGTSVGALVGALSDRPGNGPGGGAGAGAIAGRGAWAGAGAVAGAGAGALAGAGAGAVAGAGTRRGALAAAGAGAWAGAMAGAFAGAGAGAGTGSY